jgi:hypothetical protein
MKEPKSTKAKSASARPSRAGKRPLTTFQKPEHALKVRAFCSALGVSQEDFIAYAVNRLLIEMGQKDILQVTPARERILEAYRTGAIKPPKGA